MFNCVICGKRFLEKDRVFIGLDWCSDCLRKDGDYLAKTAKKKLITHPLFNTKVKVIDRLPYSVQYRNDVPKKIKDLINSLP